MHNFLCTIVPEQIQETAHNNIIAVPRHNQIYSPYELMQHYHTAPTTGSKMHASKPATTACSSMGNSCIYLIYWKH